MLIWDVWEGGAGALRSICESSWKVGPCVQVPSKDLAILVLNAAGFRFSCVRRSKLDANQWSDSSTLTLV